MLLLGQILANINVFFMVVVQSDFNWFGITQEDNKCFIVVEARYVTIFCV